MKKLIHGLHIDSLTSKNENLKNIHYEDDLLVIKSSYLPEDVMTEKITQRILPGNIGAFIYPYDSVLYFKDNRNINKQIFNKFVKDQKLFYKKNYVSNMVFDVPTENLNEEIVEEESENDISEEENEEEESVGDVSDQDWDEDEGEECPPENEGVEF